MVEKLKQFSLLICGNTSREVNIQLIYQVIVKCALENKSDYLR